MRTLFTLLFVAFFGSFAIAQSCLIETLQGPTSKLQPNKEYTFSYKYTAYNVIEAEQTPTLATWSLSLPAGATVTSTVPADLTTTKSKGFQVTVVTTDGVEDFDLEITAISDKACKAVERLTVEVLPVELTAFNAEGTAEGVNVTWETASELNNDYFTVERSFDGTNFEAIGKVYGAGNSTVVRNYSFVDDSEALAAANVAYYRLVQTDFDGKTVTLDVAEVKLQQAEKLAINNITVESDNLVRIDFSALANQEATIEMYDMTGRILGTSVVEANEGVNTVELGTISMQGIAVVRISTTTGSAVRKFVVR